MSQSVLCAINDMFLKVLGELDKVGAEAPDTDHEIPVLLGLALGRPECCCINNVKLQRYAVQLRECTDECS